MSPVLLRNATGRQPVVRIASCLKSGNTWTRLLANFLADSEQAVPINELGAVYLVRNPLDVTVSWAFHCGCDPREAAC